jgi:hypothetical protein
MKLQLKSNPTEIFDAPRGIGLALIQAGVVDAFVEPAPKIDPEVKWSLIGSYDRDLFFNADCPVCKNVATFAEPSTPFRHCARLDYAPDDLVAKLRAQVAQKKPARKAPELVQVITLD